MNTNPFTYEDDFFTTPQFKAYSDWFNGQKIAPEKYVSDTFLTRQYNNWKGQPKANTSNDSNILGDASSDLDFSVEINPVDQWLSNWDDMNLNDNISTPFESSTFNKSYPSNWNLFSDVDKSLKGTEGSFNTFGGGVGTDNLNNVWLDSDQAKNYGLSEGVYTPNELNSAGLTSNSTFSMPDWFKGSNLGATLQGLGALFGAFGAWQGAKAQKNYYENAIAENKRQFNEQFKFKTDSRDALNKAFA